MDQQQLFFNELARQFSQIFHLSQQGQDNQNERLRAQGFIQAGELCGLCSRAQVQQLMEQIHQHVFGQSLAERTATQQVRQADAERRLQRLQALADGNYDFFDEPALSRHATINKPTI